MADVNWGALTPLNQMAPIRSEAPSAPGAPVPAPASPLAGLEALNQSQQLGIAKQAGADAHQKALAEQAQAQYDIQLRQKTSQAFLDGKNKGGTDGGLDKMGEVMLENGDHEGYEKLETSRATLNGLKIANGGAGLVAVGNALANLQSQVVPPTPATPPSKDPQTGQIIPGKPASPGITSLDRYTQQYAQLKKQHPDLPAPDTFKNDGQFHDAFMVPAVATAGPAARQQAADLEAQKNSDVYKAHLDVKSTTQDLQNAIAKFGPGSAEAKEAATAYEQATSKAARVATGESFVSGAMRTAKELFGSPEKTIAQFQKERKATALEAPKAATAIPEGRVAVIAPDGTVGHIPASQLGEALKSGYKQGK